MRIRRSISPIHIDGDIARIELTQGKTAIIDARNADLVRPYVWRATLSQCTGDYYAISGSRENQVYIHRIIMFAPDSLLVDHKNHDTLDNRESNLRLCTKSQNQCNHRQRRSSNTSGYTGVCFNKQRQRYGARIGFNHQYIHLGLFDTPEKAYAAYCEAAAQLHCEFSSANPGMRISL